MSDAINLAQTIRAIDGSHDKGAAELADAILASDWLAEHDAKIWDQGFTAGFNDIPALLNLIQHLATDGGNRAAAYWLRAHDAEKQRDEAETEADRLRGLLAEAEKEADRLRGLIADTLTKEQQ